MVANASSSKKHRVDGRADDGSGETPHLPEHDPRGGSYRSGAVVTAEQLDAHFNNDDRDMAVRYVWVCGLGGCETTEPPGSDWLPVKAVLRGNIVRVGCVRKK